MKHTIHSTVIATASVALLLCSCDSTPISATGYSSSNRYSHGSKTPELSEVDFIKLPGSSGGASRPAPGSRVLLVQSGAAIPDPALTKEFGRYYHVVPFTGDRRELAGDSESSSPQVAETLRLAARRSGASHVICVWGRIESERQSHATKVVSWVPIVGQVVPDETLHSRINLKGGVLNAATGGWDAVGVNTEVDSRVTNSLNRGASRTAKTEQDKANGYEKLAKKIANDAA